MFKSFFGFGGSQPIYCRLCLELIQCLVTTCVRNLARGTFLWDGFFINERERVWVSRV